MSPAVDLQGAAGKSATPGAPPPAADSPAAREAAALIYHEARLLDGGRYEEWLDLFAADGRYWIPLTPDQAAGDRVQSIADEDLLLLRIRVARLGHPRAYSLQPRVSCRHVLQAPHIEAADPARGTVVACTSFLYAESKGEDQLVLLGAARHHLRLEDGRLRIVLKRIDLLNAGAALPAIYLLV